MKVYVILEPKDEEEFHDNIVRPFRFRIHIIHNPTDPIRVEGATVAEESIIRYRKNMSQPPSGEIFKISLDG